jgi:hypothetical protein
MDVVGAVQQGAELLLVPQALVLRRGDVRTAVGPRGVELAVIVVAEGQAVLGADLPDEARVGGQLAEAGAALVVAVRVEHRRLDGVAVVERVQLAAGAQRADVAVADPAEQADLALVADVELGAAAELAVGGAGAHHRPRVAVPVAAALLERRLDRRRQQRPAHRVRAVAGRRRPAQHLELLQRPRVDGEEVLVRPVAEGAVVQADPVEHHHRLLPGQPAHERRGLPVRGLLHVHARLVAQRVGGRARQPLLEVAPRHHARRPRVVRRLHPRLAHGRPPDLARLRGRLRRQLRPGRRRRGRGGRRRGALGDRSLGTCALGHDRTDSRRGRGRERRGERDDGGEPRRGADARRQARFSRHGQGGPDCRVSAAGRQTGPELGGSTCLKTLIGGAPPAHECGSSPGYGRRTSASRRASAEPSGGSSQ